MAQRPPPLPPQISPYFFPFVLACFGLWCLYDGWFTTNPEMQKYLLFNRVASVILLAWAAIDFVRTRKREKEDSAVPPADNEHPGK